MQHHGAPTRLLDWTSSFWVALYFASVDDWHIDGAVWLFSPYNLRERIRAIGGHALSDATQVTDLKRYSDPAANSVVQLVTPPQKTVRAAAQQGQFTVSAQVLDDHADAIPSLLGGTEVDGRLLAGTAVIPRDLKPEIVRHLRSMNITAKSLFPGADGLSRSVSELIRLGSKPE